MVFSPTLPVSDEDFEKLLAATERFPNKGIYRERTGDRIKAFLLVLRHTGLRIRDCVTLRRDALKEGRILFTPRKPVCPYMCRFPISSSLSFKNGVGSISSGRAPA